MGFAFIDVSCEEHGVQYNVMVEKGADGKPTATCGVDGCSASVSRWWGGYTGDTHGSGFAAYDAVDPATGNLIRVETRDDERALLKSEHDHLDEMERKGYHGIRRGRSSEMYVQTASEVRERFDSLLERNYEFRKKNNLPTNTMMRDLRIRL